MLHLFRQYNKNQSNPGGEAGENFISYLPQCCDSCFASTGRSLIRLLIKSLGLSDKDACLMPSYIAEGVISPFIKSGVKVLFYKVDEKLFVKLDELEKQIEGNPSIRLFVLIHPFGFEQPVNPIKKLFANKKINILEDCAQALFGKNSEGGLLGDRGEFSLFSLNKFLPVPDGAILQSHLPEIKVAVTEFEPEHEERRASIQDYIQHLHLNFEILQCNVPSEAQKILEKTAHAYELYYAFINRSQRIYAPCEETLNRLKFIDIENVIAQRIINARFLYSNLRNSTFRFVYEKLDKNCIPMTVPVYVAPEQRDEILFKLFEQNILLSTLIDKWTFIPEDKNSEFFAEKRFISSHLLIPVNEFLSINQMEIMVEIMNKI